MNRNLTDLLCTRCGLCCDGSLFADVELAGAGEVTALELLGLEVEDDERNRGLLLQPCGALEGRRCNIYAHRPKCCRTFEWGLLQQVRQGTVGLAEATGEIAEAVRQIQRIEGLIAHLGGSRGGLSLKERCAEAVLFSTNARADGERHRQRDELEAAMTGLEQLLQSRFLAV